MYHLVWILVICVSCHTILSVPCSLVVTCLESADLLAPLCVMCFCHSINDVLGQAGVVLDCTNRQNKGLKDRW